MNSNTDNSEMQILDIGQTKNLPQLSYIDDDIAILEATEGLWKTYPAQLNVSMLVICTRGKIHLQINGEEYCLHADEILLCAPNSQLADCRPDDSFYGYALCYSRKIVQENIQFSKDLLDKLFQLRKTPIISLSEQEIELFRVYRRLISIRSAMTGRHFSKEVMSSLIRSILYELVAAVYRHLPTVPSYDDRHIRSRDILFKRFIELLSSQKVKPRSVTWYSNELCVSPKYLSSICKQVSQRTAFEWINEYVQIDIRRQLKYSEASIKEIADCLGFPSISFFGKYVRQHTGHSPVEYRKILREAE
ncbi:MAG: helix-turn-helix domain-containing protein [Bacteroides sp.]